MERVIAPFFSGLWWWFSQCICLWKYSVRCGAQGGVGSGYPRICVPVGLLKFCSYVCCPSSFWDQDVRCYGFPEQAFPQVPTYLMLLVRGMQGSPISPTYLSSMASTAPAQPYSRMATSGWEGRYRTTFSPVLQQHMSGTRVEGFLISLQLEVEVFTDTAVKLGTF